MCDWLWMYAVATCRLNQPIILLRNGVVFVYNI